MSLFDEKRKSTDRRMRNDGPPPGCRERRSKKDRRQTEISEISFHDWTRHLLQFKKRAAAKAAAREASRIVKNAGAASDPAMKSSMTTIRNAHTLEYTQNAVRREDDAPDDKASSDAHSTPTIPF